MIIDMLLKHRPPTVRDADVVAPATENFRRSAGAAPLYGMLVRANYLAAIRAARFGSIDPQRKLAMSGIGRPNEGAETRQAR
jgi:hypothetical protein